MILGDSEIREKIENGDLNISPFIESNIQPASIDLRLGNEFAEVEPKSKVIDTRDPESIQTKKDTTDRLIVMPGDVVLGTTIERVELPNTLVGNVTGRSSLGRLNIVVHKTAGFIDPGFNGTITLELENEGKYPVALYAGMRACQIWFAKTTGCKKGYNKRESAQYQEQSGVTKTGKDFFLENQNI